MTTAIRPLYGMFAALLALSLIATASQAVADTRGSTNGKLPNIFDPGVVEKVTKDLQRPIGRFGVSWE